MLGRRELLIGATAGIAQLGQRVLPRITLPQLLVQSRTPALGGTILTSKGEPAVGVQGRRRSGQHVGVERDDLWLIGSNTQAMTALLYGRLAEFGKTRWGAKLTELFPEVNVDDGWRGVAVDELMAHVGGASDAPFATPEALHKWLTDTRPLSVQRQAFAKAVLTAPPQGRRGDYAFSNAGYVIVGAAIERASKLTWEACISAELFSPLAMDSAGFGAPTGPEPWGRHPHPADQSAGRGGRPAGVRAGQPGSRLAGRLRPVRAPVPDRGRRLRRSQDHQNPDHADQRRGVGPGARLAAHRGAELGGGAGAVGFHLQRLLVSQRSGWAS